jgi:hypothetical protein
VDKISHIYHGQSVNDCLTHTKRARRSYGRGGRVGSPGGRAGTQTTLVKIETSKRIISKYFKKFNKELFKLYVYLSYEIDVN